MIAADRAAGSPDEAIVAALVDLFGGSLTFHVFGLVALDVGGVIAASRHGPERLLDNWVIEARRADAPAQAVAA
ncbi:hypothetical protein [Sphingomonas canadensis]